MANYLPLRIQRTQSGKVVYLSLPQLQTTEIQRLNLNKRSNDHRSSKVNFYKIKARAQVCCHHLPPIICCFFYLFSNVIYDRYT